MQALAVPDTIVFGPFVLDLGARALRVDGEKLPLSSRAFDMLALLVAERDRVVSKDEILAKVWRGVAVEENNLAVQMSSLRRVLGEHAEGQTLILTVPGHGYRFVARLEAPRARVPAPAILPPDPVPPPRPHLPDAARRPSVRWLVVAVIGLLCLGGLWAGWQRFTTPQAPRLSIAVLPFRNLGDDRKQDYLADAISDDLTTDLSHLPGSVVIARESSDVYKGRAVPAQQIGRDLNVRYLLEGSLRDVGGIFHVNAQLIDARDGSHLWAEAFDAPRTQLGDAQAAIVRNIAGALDVRLVAIESERSRIERQNNPDALDLYLQGRSIEDAAQSLEQLSQAQALFEKAIAAQPTYVEAMADLALLLLEKLREHDDPDDATDWSRANALIKQVLTLAPNNVKALTARGLQQNLDHRLRESEASLRAALDLDKTNLQALSQLAQDEWRLGKPKAAVDLYQEIMRLDPQGPDWKKRIASLGMALFMTGRYQDAIDDLLRSLAGDAQERSAGGDRIEFSNMFLIAAYDRAGNRDQAQKLYQTYAQHWPHRSVWRLCSYFSKAQASLPEFAALKAGLEDAGMLEFEHQPQAGATVPSPAAGGDFGPAPANIEGAVAVNVADLEATLARSPKPAVFDVGSGAATMKEAVWIPNPDDAAGGLDDHLAQIDPSQPILLVGDGFYSMSAYSAAQRVRKIGHHPVMWLVGGEEALAAAGFSTIDRRAP
jgi:TolB-like protein/DNA-binding winged helix-turn-helix (wHTH) protein/Tfp pilus assembly protein PilF